MEPAVRDMLLQNQLRINRKKFAERWIYRKSTVFFVWFYLLLVRFYADLFSWSGILVSIPTLLTFNFSNLQYLHALCDFALKKKKCRRMIWLCDRQSYAVFLSELFGKDMLIQFLRLSIQRQGWAQIIFRKIKKWESKKRGSSSVLTTGVNTIFYRL